MSQLDALLARSRSPGTFVTRKRFTLARHKAIEKMREFALRHPRQYILELVQAAVFAGATWIAIDVRDDGVLVGWVGGEPLTSASLENIFDYLFVDQADLKRRHLMQLAVGLNAIYQRKPNVVRIESGDGTLDGTARMELDSKGQVQVGQPSEGLGGTYLYVEFYSGWWERFFKSGTSGESRLIEERCLYTPVPILLNGSAPFGYRSSRAIQLFGVTRAASLDQGDRRGAIGVVRQGVRPEFRIVVGGVWIGTDELKVLGNSLGGVIADNGLRKTADMSDIVRDERWVRMLHAVQPEANTLMRQVHGRGYRPPALPPMPEIREPDPELPTPTGPTRPAPVPIEAAIPQLCSSRAPIRLEQLDDLPPGSPVFWVSPDQAEELEPAGDPLDFPFHVLLLSEGESIWLSETDAPIALSRMATTADFGFVNRILSRRAESREAIAPITVAGQDGRLTLRLHVEGTPPHWGTGPGVPTLIRVGGDTARTLRLPLELGPLSLIAEFDEAPDVDDLDVALVRHALGESWRLLSHDAKDTATRSLLRSVLALHARPTFVENAGDKTVDAVLPSDWGAARRSLRDATLAMTTEGPLTLQSFLGLLNSGQIAVIEDATEFDELSALEEAFGYGHLAHPKRGAFPLVAVGLSNRGWLRVRHDLKSEPRVLIGLRDGLDTPTPDAGWTRIATLSPIEAWAQEGFENEDLTEGLKGLGQLLASFSEENPAKLPEGLRTRRAHAMLRLALFRLAEKSEIPLRIHATSGEHVDIDKLGPRLAVAPLHGPQVTEHETVAMTYDELCSLERSRGPVTLRFDDPASVWHDLTEDGEGWLIRHEIRVPGVEGWLGLRFPYDPTAAILVETSRNLLSLGEVDRQAPCHGLLWARSTSTGLQSAQIELVRLGAIQLYQRLLEMLDADLVGLARTTAQGYAASYALLTAARKGALPSGTARELAAHVDVLDADGVRWGSLERWLDAEPDRRPLLPATWARFYEPAHEGEVELIELDDVSDRIARRLRTALSALSEDVWVDVNFAELNSGHVAVRPYESTSLRVAVTLNRSGSAAVRLAHTEPRVFEMLLLECARQVALWRDDHIHFEDLARMIIAQRLTS
ncbi:MAG: hypothetical protein KC912_16535 [Proteobacteria bacterium]|nr:hypothetical protein [Pseudomonadota bacterium]